MPNHEPGLQGKMKALGFRYHQLVKKGKGIEEEEAFKEMMLRR